MREILFRGRTAEGEWFDGVYLPLKDGDNPVEHYIYGKAKVLPETVGQFTGLTDKNGKRMFEADIVSGLFLHSCPVNGVVSFENGSFGLLWNRAGAETFWAFTSICNVEYEVIGNIHDNPELLEVTQ